MNIILSDIVWVKLVFLCIQYGSTALHVASDNGHLAVVVMLIKRGANVNKATMVLI